MQARASWLARVWGGLAWLGATAAAAAGPDFNREIRPILSHNCFACHGHDEHDRQAGLRLDDRVAATSELDSGSTAIVPGDPAASELVVRIRETDPDLVMPPAGGNHTLTPEQKATLEAWIAAGAEYAAHWAYVAPVARAEPDVTDPAWCLNWIDRFVLAGL